MNNINLESELNMNIDSMNQETLITNNVQARVSFAKEIGKKTIEDLTRKLSWEIPQNYYTLKYTKAIMLERNYGEFLITLNFYKL